MVRFHSGALRAAFFTTAAAIFAANANAEQARFTLPYETHWGLATLPPGEYTLSTWSDSTWPKVLSVSGHGKTVFILAGIASVNDNAEGSYLEIANVGGVRFVQKFQSGVFGKTFEFEAPKSLRAEMAAGRGPQQTTRVAVLTRH